MRFFGIKFKKFLDYCPIECSKGEIGISNFRVYYVAVFAVLYARSRHGFSRDFCSYTPTLRLGGECTASAGTDTRRSVAIGGAWSSSSAVSEPPYTQPVSRPVAYGACCSPARTQAAA